MDIKRVDQFNLALSHGAYAWPGGYPLYFICADGGALSFAAAEENAGLIRDAIIAGPNTGNDDWRVIGMDVNWEDDSLTCDHTGKRIPSAYGDDSGEA